MENKKLSAKEFEPKYKLDINSVLSFVPHRLFNKERHIIDYDVKLSNGKNLQRDFVWTIEQKRSLIISMLKGLQIPNFAVVQYRNDLDFSSKKPTTLKVIDGKQRLKTIEDFLNNEFSLLFNGLEYFYTDLDDDAQHKISTYTLLFNLIYEYDDIMLSDEQLISWFELVNFAGTPQDLDHLEKLKS